MNRDLANIKVRKGNTMNVKLLETCGRLQIQIDGEIIDSLGFKSFRPKDFNISDFYQAGVRIFNIITTGRCSIYGMPYSLFGESWLGDGLYDFTVVDQQIDFFIKHAPDAYFIINFQLDTRSWWLDEHPGSVDSYTHLSQVAADPEWRSSASDYLQKLINHVEAKYQNRVIGYVLLGGNTTEWFSNDDYEESHPTKLLAYRHYLGNESIEIPEKSRLEPDNSQLFLDPIQDADIIEYRKFHNQLIADTVLHFVEKAQEVLCHRKLVGVFFGYLLELLGPRLWNVGHLDIDRVYHSPHIDFIATPSSYQYRKHEDASAYMLMSSTLALNKKLYFISFDHRTYLYNTNVDGFHVPAPGVILKDNRQITNVMRREMMQRLCNGAGHWWFDMFSGWFRDPEIMAEVAHLVKISDSLLRVPMKSCSEIAIVLSCEAMYYVNKMSEINSFTICKARDNWARMGAPYDIYSIGDIQNINWKQYKLCIFPNAFMITDEDKKIIKEKILCDNRTVLWMTAADYIHKDGFSVQAMNQWLGMEFEELTDEETAAEAYDSTYGNYTHPLHPTFCVRETGVEVLGKYKNSQKVSLAKRAHSDYTVIFSGLGNLSYRILHEIAKQAGVHMYANAGIPVYVNSALCGIYNHELSEINITLKNSGVYKDVFTGKTYETKDGQINLLTDESAARLLVRIEGEDTQY